MRIVPGILARSAKEFSRQAKCVAWASKVHVDVMDGKFVRQKTSQGKISTSVQFHFMVRDAQKYLRGKEIIVHAESKSPLVILKNAKTKGLRAGIAFNPEASVIRELINAADFALVMTVNPGRSGQKMLRNALKKIKLIKKLKRISVGVDGGINFSTILAAKKAGADFVVATSAVTLAKEPLKAFKELKKLCR